MQFSRLFAGCNGFLDDIQNNKIPEFKKCWFDYFESNMPQLNDKLNSGEKMNDEDIEALKKNISSFKSGFCGE